MTGRNPFVHSQKYPFLTTPAEAEALQYQFELGRIMDSYQRGSISPADKDSLVNALMDSAGVQSPADRSEILNHPLLTQRIPVQKIEEQPEEYEFSLWDSTKEVLDSFANFGSLNKQAIGSVMNAYGTLDKEDNLVGQFFSFLKDPDSTGEDFALWMQETGQQLQQEGRQELAESGYQQPKTMIGQAGKALVEMAPQLGLGAAAYGVGSALTSPIGGHVAAQSLMQLYASLQVAGEGIDSIQNNPTYQKILQRLPENERAAAKEEMVNNAARLAYSNRLTGASTAIDVMSAGRLPLKRFPILGNILFDAGTEAGSEFFDTVASGTAVNQSMKDFATKKGMTDIAEDSSLKTGTFEWLSDAENRAAALQGAAVGGLVGGSVSGVVTPMQAYLGRKADANQRQVLDEAKTAADKATDQSIREAGEQELYRQKVRLASANADTAEIKRDQQLGLLPQPETVEQLDYTPREQIEYKPQDPRYEQMTERQKLALKKRVAQTGRPMEEIIDEMMPGLSAEPSAESSATSTTEASVIEAPVIPDPVETAPVDIEEPALETPEASPKAAKTKSTPKVSAKLKSVKAPQSKTEINQPAPAPQTSETKKPTAKPAPKTKEAKKLAERKAEVKKPLEAPLETAEIDQDVARRVRNREAERNLREKTLLDYVPPAKVDENIVYGPEKPGEKPPAQMPATNKPPKTAAPGTIEGELTPEQEKNLNELDRLLDRQNQQRRRKVEAGDANVAEAPSPKLPLSRKGSLLR